MNDRNPNNVDNHGPESQINSVDGEVLIGFITKKWAESHHISTHYEKINPSTNDWAKKDAFAPAIVEESLALYLTENQTMGRGRGLNKWKNAQPGSSLLCSWSFSLQDPPQPTTTCLVGLGLYRACYAIWPFLPWSLKAPNDLFIGSKKAAGILCETIQQGEDCRLIVGVGLNVTASPKEIENSTSILETLPRGVPLNGEDWVGFLDRFFFEMAEVAGRCVQPLSSTETKSLLYILNKNPILTEPYTDVLTDGTLMRGRSRLEWL